MGNKQSTKIIPIEYNNDDTCYYIGDVVKRKENGESIYVKEGQGKLIWKDNTTYLGSFKNDMMNGLGTMSYDDGAIYEGSWVNDVRHGKGILKYANGVKYEGDFKLDEQHGKGKLTYDNGDYYMGDFSLSVINGKGELFNSQGQRVYKGTWFNNQFHGLGKYYYSNGKLQFKGNWKYSLAHGIGVNYDENGKIKDFGVYSNGYLIKDLMKDIYFVLQDYLSEIEEEDMLEDYITWKNGNYVPTPNVEQPIDFESESPTNSNETVTPSTLRIKPGEGATSPHMGTIKHNVIENPLVQLATTNKFLFNSNQNKLVRCRLPSFAERMIDNSVEKNKSAFSPTLILGDDTYLQKIKSKHQKVSKFKKFKNMFSRNKNKTKERTKVNSHVIKVNPAHNKRKERPNPIDTVVEHRRTTSNNTSNTSYTQNSTSTQNSTLTQSTNGSNPLYDSSSKTTVSTTNPIKQIDSSIFSKNKVLATNNSFKYEIKNGQITSNNPLNIVNNKPYNYNPNRKSKYMVRERPKSAASSFQSTRHLTAVTAKRTQERDNPLNILNINKDKSTTTRTINNKGEIQLNNPLYNAMPKLNKSPSNKPSVNVNITTEQIIPKGKINKNSQILKNPLYVNTNTSNKRLATMIT